MHPARLARSHEGGVDGRANERFQWLDVLLELSEHVHGAYTLTGLDSGVEVGDECDRGVAELELAGQDGLGVTGHVHQRPALPGEPLAFRAGREAWAFDHHHRPTVDDAVLQGRPAKLVTVGIGEFYVHAAFFEVRLIASAGAVHELIRDHHGARTVLGYETATAQGAKTRCTPSIRSAHMLARYGRVCGEYSCRAPCRGRNATLRPLTSPIVMSPLVGPYGVSSETVRASAEKNE
ncbi:hypothetical protein BJF84_25715 [Rhodococcus sp. CUA-806]|nr:hypothetical protein BJF84_25715 [Rhodococcus sp. CUA-806]